MIIRKSIIQVFILNNVEFCEYLFQKDRDTIFVINITKESQDQNKHGVKYSHRSPGFREDQILGYNFDGISEPLVSLSYLGICLDLYEIRDDPFLMTHGPFEDLDAEKVNELRGIAINIID